VPISQRTTAKTTVRSALKSGVASKETSKNFPKSQEMTFGNHLSKLDKKSASSVKQNQPYFSSVDTSEGVANEAGS